MSPIGSPGGGPTASTGAGADRATEQTGYGFVPVALGQSSPSALCVLALLSARDPGIHQSHQGNH